MCHLTIDPPRRRRGDLWVSYLLVAAALAIGLLAGCSPPPEAPETRCVRVARGLYRCHDAVAQVTCWDMGDARGGIACLPDSQVSPGAR